MKNPESAFHTLGWLKKSPKSPQKIQQRPAWCKHHQPKLIIAAVVLTALASSNVYFKESQMLVTAEEKVVQAKGKKQPKAFNGSGAPLLSREYSASGAQTMATTKTAKNQTQPNHHCVIHVHGLQHSGTGFLRQQIHDKVLEGRASKHHKTPAPQDEGQHLQKVYPALGGRGTNLARCGLKKGGEAMHVGRLYYCPELVETIPHKQGTKERLFDYWSQHWNMSQPFLIQKTPSLDVVFLEHMKLHPTFHAIIIRHPFRWYQRQVRNITRFFPKDYLIYPFAWLDVWAYVLEQLMEGQVESFAVVNYEALADPLQQQDILFELSSLIHDGCHMERIINVQEGSATGVRRKLNVYGPKKNSSKFQPLVEHEKDLWNACEDHVLCHNLMGDLEPVIAELGYTWDMERFYVPPENMEDRGKVTFSSQKMPSKELVEKLKSLATKYVVPIVR